MQKQMGNPQAFNKKNRSTTDIADIPFADLLLALRKVLPEGDLYGGVGGMDAAVERTGMYLQRPP